MRCKKEEKGVGDQAVLAWPRLLAAPSESPRSPRTSAFPLTSLIYLSDHRVTWHDNKPIGNF